MNNDTKTNLNLAFVFCASIDGCHVNRFSNLCSAACVS